MKKYRKYGMYTEKGDIRFNKLDVYKGDEDSAYVWRYESIEDFEETDDPEKGGVNWESYKKEFREYIGKVWEDREDIRYMVNGIPVYKRYRVIALEDDYSMLDWYWVVVNEEGKEKYILANSWGMRDGIVGGR